MSPRRHHQNAPYQILTRFFCQEPSRTRQKGQTAEVALGRIEPEDQIARSALVALRTNHAPEIRDIAAVELWRLGLETNLPVDEIAAGAKRPVERQVLLLRRGRIFTSQDMPPVSASQWSHPERAIELLGEIGPAASNGLPVLETYLTLGFGFRREAAIAIRKISPAEAARLRLPGLLIAPHGN